MKAHTLTPQTAPRTTAPRTTAPAPRPHRSPVPRPSSQRNPFTSSDYRATFDAFALWHYVAGSGGVRLGSNRELTWTVPGAPGDWRIFYFCGLVSVADGHIRVKADRDDSNWSVVFYRCGELAPSFTLAYGPNGQDDHKACYAETLALYEETEAGVTIYERDGIVYAMRPDGRNLAAAIHSLQEQM